MTVNVGRLEAVDPKEIIAMKMRMLVVLVPILCGWGVPHVFAAGSRRPQGYRHVDLQEPYQRTYGGYWV